MVFPWSQSDPIPSHQSTGAAGVPYVCSWCGRCVAAVLFSQRFLDDRVDVYDLALSRDSMPANFRNLVGRVG